MQARDSTDLGYFNTGIWSLLNAIPDDRFNPIDKNTKVMNEGHKEFRIQAMIKWRDV